jgi:hypothetical protein
MKDKLYRRLRRPGDRENSVPRALRNARRRLALLSTALLLSLAGCGSFGRSPSTKSDGGFFGWHFYAPFDTSEVKTVAVFFKSNSFRRGIEQQLTEAVQKEITMRTPFKLESDHTKADSLLSGVITYANKGLVVEAPTNFARELNMTINVAVKWTRNPPTELEAVALPTMVVETINFVPEVGDTTLGATNHVVQALAKQIVDMMEQPWFNDNDVQ